MQKLIWVTTGFGRIMILILQVTAVRLRCVWMHLCLFGCHGNHYYLMTLISQSLGVWIMFVLLRWYCDVIYIYIYIYIYIHYYQYQKSTFDQKRKQTHLSLLAHALITCTCWERSRNSYIGLLVLHLLILSPCKIALK